MKTLVSILAALAAMIPAAAADTELIVSVADQRLWLIKDGSRVASYAVSTSKFGIGSQARSYKTPLGTLAVTRKVGAGAPLGAVFKGLRSTGEILRPNAPGRDPIVTRVLCLTGTEPRNRNTGMRGIYIHGTPEERKIGRPASYGCIRMRSRDVARLFERVPVGAKVTITPLPLAQVATADAGRD